MSGELLVDPLT